MSDGAAYADNPPLSVKCALALGIALVRAGCHILRAIDAGLLPAAWLTGGPARPAGAEVELSRMRVPTRAHSSGRRLTLVAGGGGGGEGLGGGSGGKGRSNLQR